jgi:hypothetical protein
MFGFLNFFDSKCDFSDFSNDRCYVDDDEADSFRRKREQEAKQAQRNMQLLEDEKFKKLKQLVQDIEDFKTASIEFMKAKYKIDFAFSTERISRYSDKDDDIFAEAIKASDQDIEDALREAEESLNAAKAEAQATLDRISSSRLRSTFGRDISIDDGARKQLMSNYKIVPHLTTLNNKENLGEIHQQINEITLLVKELNLESSKVKNKI